MARLWSGSASRPCGLWHVPISCATGTRQTCLLGGSGSQSVDTKNDDGTFSAYRLIVLKSLNYDLMYSSLKCRPNF
jgi:hypothetical protein